MIINFPIKCNVCETIALIKVGIGYQLTHNQKWECKECSTINEFSFDAIGGNFNELPRNENFRFVNCQLIDKNFTEINVSYSLFFDVDFIAPKYINEPFSPEALLSRLSRIHQEFNSENYLEIEPLRRKTLEISFHLFKLFLLNKYDVLDKIAKKNKTNIAYKRNKEPLHYAFDYLSLQSANIGNDLYDILSRVWNTIPEVEKDKLKGFSKINSISMNKKLIPVFDNYISNLDLFWSVFRRERQGLDLVDENQLVFSFTSVKNVYADCYEILSDYLFIIAGINNYKERGDVSRFEKINGLNDYQKLDNGSKLNPFKNSKVFGFFTSIYINKIRNSCNHNDVEIDVENNVILFKDENYCESLTIQEYLLLCHKIISVLSSLILFNELCILGKN